MMGMEKLVSDAVCGGCIHYGVFYPCSGGVYAAMRPRRHTRIMMWRRGRRRYKQYIHAVEAASTPPYP